MSSGALSRLALLLLVAALGVSGSVSIDIEKLKEERLRLVNEALLQELQEVERWNALGAAPEDDLFALTSEALSRRVRSVAAGEIDFHEYEFGSPVDFYWNSKKPTYVLARVTRDLRLSKNSGESFDSILKNVPNGLVTSPAAYDHAASTGVRRFFIDANDDNHVVCIGYGEFYWVTHDGGDTWGQIMTPGLYFTSFRIHPTMKNLMLATHVPQVCYDQGSAAGGACSLELHLTTDGGITWKRIATHVWQYEWGYTKLSSGRQDDSVYIISTTDTTRSQYTVSGGVISDSSTRNFARSLNVYDISDDATTLEYKDAFNMLVLGDYVFALVLVDGISEEAMVVSYQGLPFRTSTLTNVGISSFVLYDVYEGGVVLCQFTNSRGSVWTSNGGGYEFTRSLNDLVFIVSGRVWADFSKIRGFSSTYMANTFAGTASLRTRISWNRGATWTSLVTSEGLAGTVNDNAHPLFLYGLLHGQASGDHPGVYSEETAPGIIIGVGARDVTLADYIKLNQKADVWMSRNGGATFSRILTGAHYCRLLDEGVVILCVASDAPTDTIKYSFTGGASWETEKFTTRPVNIVDVETDRLRIGLHVIIEATEIGDDLGDDIFFAFDLADLDLRACTEDDREKWSPSDMSANGRQCLLGQHVTYTRAKAGPRCHSSLDAVVALEEPCACATEDFECAYNYTRIDASRTCELEAGAIISQPPCSNGMYTPASPYRLIPGDKCSVEMEGAVDLAASATVTCPSQGTIDDVTRQRNIAIVAGLSAVLVAIAMSALAVVFYRKYKYRRYRHVALNDLTMSSVTVEDDADLFEDDHIDDADEEERGSR